MLELKRKNGCAKIPIISMVLTSNISTLVRTANGMSMTKSAALLVLPDRANKPPMTMMVVVAINEPRRVR